MMDTAVTDRNFKRLHELASDYSETLDKLKGLALRTNSQEFQLGGNFFTFTEIVTN